MADGKVKIDIIADDSDASQKINETGESLDNLGKKTDETSKKTKESKTRFQELTEKILAQSKELESLKSEYVETAINLGRNSKEAEELREKYNALNRELKENEEALDGVKKGLEDVGENSDKSEKSLGLFDLVLGNLASGGIESFLTGIKDAIVNLASLAEETREYREDMAKLDTAFKTQNHSVEAGQAAYEDFYAILGESDRSVEAVNHLAELTNNTEELSKWSTIASGVTAKFGDSLPIEGLTEAANETAKVGKVTGVFADTLNWVSKDSAVFKQSLGGNQKALAAFNKALKDGENVEDAFSAALSKMSTEQERSAAITNTLNGIYSDAAAEYNTLTAETQKARRETAEMEAAQARLGAALEPLSIKLTEAQTALLELAADALTAKQASDVLTESQRESVTVAHEAAEAYRETKEAAHEAALSQLSDVEYATNYLLPQLKEIVDENGKVKQGYQERAEFLLGQMNEAWGTEYTRISEIIGKNGELKQSVLDVIEAKKAQILLAPLEADYTKAIENQAAAESAWITQTQAVAQAYADVQTAEENLTRAKEEATGKRGMMSQIEVDEANVVLAEKKRVLKEQTEAYEKADSDIQEYYADIGAYQHAYGLLMEGKTAEAIGYLNNLNAGYDKTTGVVQSNAEKQRAILERQAIDTGVKAVLMREKYEAGIAGVTEDMVKTAEEAAKTAATAFEQVGGNIGEGIGVGAVAEEPSLLTKIKNIVANMKKAAEEEAGIASPAKEFAWDGEMMVKGLIVGAENERKEAVNTFSSITKDVIGGVEKEIESGIKRIDKELERLDDVRTTANAKSVDAQKKALNKEKKALQEREKAFSEFARTHEKQLSEMAKLEDDYAKNMLKVQETLTKDIEKAWTDFENTRDSRAESIVNSLSLFSKVEKREAADGKTLTRNLAGQVKELEKYNKAIYDLSMRDVDSTFLAEMMGLGVSNLPELQALVRMSDEELTKYADMWNEKNRLAGAAAAKSLEGAREETVKQVAGLIDAAKQEAEGLTTEYQNAMVDLLKEVQTGMLGVSEAGVKALGNDLADYFNAGRDLMGSVADGIEDGKSEILDALLSTIDAALLDAGIKEELKATVSAENARYGRTAGVADNGMTELAHAVGVQGAGINSLVKQGQSRSGNTTVVLQVDKRELGRAVVDTGKSETVRAGIKT